MSSPTPVVCKVIKRSEKGLFPWISFFCHEQPQIWSYLQSAGARAGLYETSPFWPLLQMLAMDYSSCFQETSNIPVWRMSPYGHSVSESIEAETMLSHFDKVHRWSSVTVVVLGERSRCLMFVRGLEGGLERSVENMV